MCARVCVCVGVCVFMYEGQMISVTRFSEVRQTDHDMAYFIFSI